MKRELQSVFKHCSVHGSNVRFRTRVAQRDIVRDIGDRRYIGWFGSTGVRKIVQHTTLSIELMSVKLELGCKMSMDSYLTICRFATTEDSTLKNPIG